MFNSAAIIPAVGTGTGTYHHHDALGNVVALTNAASYAVLETYTYDPFGKRTVYNATGQQIPDTAYANTHGYTGREHLPLHGLMDYRNRSYSTTLGRFLQTDPIRFDAGDVNLYRYVGNEPVSWIDPLGLKSSGSSRGGTPRRGDPGTQKIPPNHVPEGQGNYPRALRNLVNFIDDTQEQRETNQGANTFGEIVAKCNSWKNSLPNSNCACCPTVILLRFTNPGTKPTTNKLGMNIPATKPSGGSNIIDYQMNFIEKKCSEVSDSDFPPGFWFDWTYESERKIKL